MMRKSTLLLAIFCTVLFYAQKYSTSKKDSVSIDYRRSSLSTFMLDNKSIEYDEAVQNAFMTKFTPDKYNNHNLPDNTRLIPKNALNIDDVKYIENYLNEQKIGNELVAKWFNRSKEGAFNADLVLKRGFYDAKELDRKIAQNTSRGESSLGDKGAELIDNTFVIVMKSNYTNKESIAKGLGAGLSLLSQSFLQEGNQLASSLTDLTKLTTDTFGKGFWVGTKSYLFKLVWDADTRDRFYNELWADNQSITPEKKAAFDNADFFKVKFVGQTKTGADIQSTTLSGKSNEQLVERATIKSFDKAINNLQRSYDVFSVKIPVFTVDPVITIKAGMKEGIDKKSKFDVLERVIKEDGSEELVVVGKMKVDTDYPIWDNRYGADEENPNQEVDVTVLRVSKMKGEIVPGMLLMQTN
ncbi:MULTISPECIES: hypothetical protein [Chryseobacterium]|uniref:hypothetical protein n=1 Tax=Chryseobacterium sp. R2A-55 TaxID=2744445 RepID=UPI001F46C13E|nr:hypothetical protein [Chryseobacterium sp. R2A-55]